MTTTDGAGLPFEIGDLRRALEAVFTHHAVPGALHLLPPAEPPSENRAKIVVVGRGGTGTQGHGGTGKTSLINAVLRRPDFLFPEPTLTAVTVTAATAAEVRVHCFDGSVVIDDDLDHLDRWQHSNFNGNPCY
jgi:hypothetical protein